MQQLMIQHYTISFFINNSKPKFFPSNKMINMQNFLQYGIQEKEVSNALHLCPRKCQQVET